jgi:hypothetical protein
MKCLQQKYAKLEDKCKAAVGDFTQKTMSDASLDFLLMKACESSVQIFCSVTIRHYIFFKYCLYFPHRILKLDKTMI